MESMEGTPPLMTVVPGRLGPMVQSSHGVGVGAADSHGDASPSPKASAEIAHASSSPRTSARMGAS